MERGFVRPAAESEYGGGGGADLNKPTVITVSAPANYPNATSTYPPISPSILTIRWQDGGYIEEIRGDTNVMGLAALYCFDDIWDTSPFSLRGSFILLRAVANNGNDLDNGTLYTFNSNGTVEIATIADGLVGSGTIMAFTRVGNTSSRPISPNIGQPFFDSTLGLPIWWNGTSWVKSDGTTA